MKHRILLLITVVIFSCDTSKTHNGKDFIGLWESNDTLKIKIEIKEKYREGKKIDYRYQLKVIDGKDKMPKYFIQEGQYNYQLVTAKPEFNQHPFMEFIHKNSFGDTIPYLGLGNGNKTLIRRYRYDDIPELEFIKIE